MNKNFIAWAAVAALLVLSFIFYLYLQERTGALGVSEDFRELTGHCPMNSACCLSSAKIIAKGGYSVIANYKGGCGAGYVPNTLKCLGSLSWCEPIKE